MSDRLNLSDAFERWTSAHARLLAAERRFDRIVNSQARLDPDLVARLQASMRDARVEADRLLEIALAMLPPVR